MQFLRINPYFSLFLFKKAKHVPAVLEREEIPRRAKSIACNKACSIGSGAPRKG